jgi:hypothetical protein
MGVVVERLGKLTPEGPIIGQANSKKLNPQNGLLVCLRIQTKIRACLAIFLPGVACRTLLFRR